MTLESLHRKALSIAAKYQLPWNYEIEVIHSLNSNGCSYRIELTPDIPKWDNVFSWQDWHTESVATPDEVLHEFDALLDENTTNLS